MKERLLVLLIIMIIFFSTFIIPHKNITWNYMPQKYLVSDEAEPGVLSYKGYYL